MTRCPRFALGFLCSCEGQALIENIPRSNDAVVESEEVDLLVLRKEDYQLTMNAYRAEEILKTLAIPTADRTDADLRTLKQVPQGVLAIAVPCPDTSRASPPLSPLLSERNAMC